MKIEATIESDASAKTRESQRERVRITGHIQGERDWVVGHALDASGRLEY